MKSLSLGIIFSFITLSGIAQNMPLPGNWQGIIEYTQEDVPFEFLLENIEDIIRVTIINGEERIFIDSVSISGDSIVIPLRPFDAEIKAKFDSHSMQGYWKKGYKKDFIPFHAIYGKPRFEGGTRKYKLSYKWNLKFERPSKVTYTNLGLFEFNNGKAQGSILSEVGDYRYFEGVIRNDSLLMSSFDGVHGFEIKALLSENQLSGVFHFDNEYTEQITGAVDETVELISPLKKMDTHQRPFFNILTAGNPNDRIDESIYFDKILVLQLFGTWCPNSKDQTEFLTEWYKSKPDNVEVLAVTYEPNFSTEYGLKRIESYKKDMKIPYDIKLGGELSKGQAALALPYQDKINAFPTLVIIDKYGFTRYQFDYFNGPATGQYFEKFKEGFEEAINTLVSE